MRRLLPLLLCLGLGACAAPGSGPAVGSDGLPECATLPAEAVETIGTIADGGPFPYPDNDDKRFGNYEGVLPSEPRDYYREYTVDTPGLGHRGARRIVTGGTLPIDDWFYTDDHYETFCRITDAQLADAEEKAGEKAEVPRV